MENSINECKRILRAATTVPLKYVNLSSRFRLIVFGLAQKTKKLYKSLVYNSSSRSLALLEIVASGYATDAGGIIDSIVSKNGHVTHRSCLNSDIEEADLRIIPHVSDAVKEGFDCIIVLSNCFECY